MKKNSILKLNSVSKRFRSVIAVDDFSLEIGSGEIFALIGPNGSGKTTTIKMIAGILRPTNGEITIDGYQIAKEPERAKYQTGYIPDNPDIWEKLTGREFLNFVGSIFNLRQKEIDKRSKEYLDLFGIGEQVDGHFEDYSRGTKQKLTIIAAFLHQPKLLLVDEPVVGLDPESIKITIRLFNNFAKAGGAILLATHTLSTAQEIATGVGVLIDGKLKVSEKLAEPSKKRRFPSASLEDLYFQLTK